MKKNVLSLAICSILATSSLTFAATKIFTTKIDNINFSTIAVDGKQYIDKNQVTNYINKLKDKTTTTSSVNITKSTSNPTPNTVKPKELLDTFKDGVYGVGIDIKEGEYVFIKTAPNDYFLTNSTPDLLIKKNIYESAINNRFTIRLQKGEWIKIQNAQAYLIDKAPKPTIIDNTLQAGTYKVGTDLPAGNYKLKVVNTKITSSYTIYADNNFLTMTGNIFESNNFNNEINITVKDGQFIRFFNSVLELK